MRYSGVSVSMFYFDIWCKFRGINISAVTHSVVHSPQSPLLGLPVGTLDPFYSLSLGWLGQQAFTWVDVMSFPTLFVATEAPLEIRLGTTWPLNLVPRLFYSPDSHREPGERVWWQIPPVKTAGALRSNAILHVRKIIAARSDGPKIFQTWE